LPNERALSEHYGVARHTIRRAMHVVVQDGLTSRELGCGTMIKEKPSSDMIDLVQRIFGVSPLDNVNIRLIIEPQAAVSAATNASESELGNIRLAHEAAVAGIAQKTTSRPTQNFTDAFS
jgi:DNA-binding FadR family transcriptional regulator